MTFLARLTELIAKQNWDAVAEHLCDHAEAIRDLVVAAEQMQRAMDYTSGVGTDYATDQLREALAKLEES